MLQAGCFAYGLVGLFAGVGSAWILCATTLAIGVIVVGFVAVFTEGSRESLVAFAGDDSVGSGTSSVSIAGIGFAFAIDDTLAVLVVGSGVAGTFCFSAVRLTDRFVGRFTGVGSAGVVGATSPSIGVIPGSFVAIVAGLALEAWVAFAGDHASLDLTGSMSIACVALANLVLYALTVFVVVSGITETLGLLVFYLTTCFVGLLAGVGQTGVVGTTAGTVGVVTIGFVAFVTEGSLVALVASAGHFFVAIFANTVAVAGVGFAGLVRNALTVVIVSSSVAQTLGLAIFHATQITSGLFAWIGFTEILFAVA